MEFKLADLQRKIISTGQPTGTLEELVAKVNTATALCPCCDQFFFDWEKVETGEQCAVCHNDPRRADALTKWVYNRALQAAQERDAQALQTIIDGTIGGPAFRALVWLDQLKESEETKS